MLHIQSNTPDRPNLHSAILYLLVTVFLVLSPQTSLAQSTKGLSREVNQETSVDSKNLKLAIVVGIDEYSAFSGVSPLRYAVADAKSLHSSLSAQGYNVLKLHNGEATSHFISKAISEIASLAKTPEQRKAATLVFSFSGHGFAQQDANYLVTVDTDSDSLSTTGLALSDVIDAMKATGIAKKILIIDACRNNPGQKSAASSFIDQSAEGVGILFSTRSGAVSYESSLLGGGVFTHFVAKGLNGKAADESGQVSFHSLKQYVEQQVPAWTIKNLQLVQTPYQAGEYTGTLHLASVTPPPMTNTQPVVTNNNQATIANNSVQRNIFISSKGKMANIFSKQLSQYIQSHYDIEITNTQGTQSLTITLSTDQLELLQDGQQHKIQGELYISSHDQHNDQEQSAEFISIQGSSYENKLSAINIAADDWVKQIPMSELEAALNNFTQP